MRNGKSSLARPSATVRDKYARGKALRAQVPREAHSDLNLAQRDPVEVLRSSDTGRLEELLWIRYARMATSPFAFYRGAAAIMAGDLAQTPVTGVRAQLCGDAHLMNFGGFGTPERNFIFDIDDFDETIEGPWEWDVKRLAASVAVASRQLGYRRKQKEAAVAACLAAYREATHMYAAMSVLEVWYSRIDASLIVREVLREGAGSSTKQLESRLRRRTSSHAFPKLTRVVDGRRKIVDDPPLIYHEPDSAGASNLGATLHAYRASLPPERRRLFERYEWVDYALKVVGVGSVGTRCYIALFMAAEDDPLILQVKEARASVLAPHCGPSPFANGGERVVAGQRLIQASSDIFLGWTAYAQVPGHELYFYVRQLRDMKTSANIEAMTSEQFVRYVGYCGHALAHAHAKSGEPAVIAGYIGRSVAFDRAVARFADAYVDVNERDHAALLRAIAARLVPTQPEGATELV
jgi:uncharacterized protein (DUF2252 family)